MQISKAVDTAVKEIYAVLAGAAAKHAVNDANFGNFVRADAAMAWVEKWLKKAGAGATRCSFRRPS